jgi:hypothetical protein
MLECIKDDGKEKCRFGIAVSSKNGDCFGHGKCGPKRNRETTLRFIRDNPHIYIDAVAVRGISDMGSNLRNTL